MIGKVNEKRFLWKWKGYYVLGWNGFGEICLGSW